MEQKTAANPPKSTSESPFKAPDEPFKASAKSDAPEPEPKRGPPTAEQRRDTALAQMNVILAQYGGEALVPYHHSYWGIRNQFFKANVEIQEAS